MVDEWENHVLTSYKTWGFDEYVRKLNAIGEGHLIDKPRTACIFCKQITEETPKLMTPYLRQASVLAPLSPLLGDGDHFIVGVSGKVESLALFDSQNGKFRGQFELGCVEQPVCLAPMQKHFLANTLPRVGWQLCWFWVRSNGMARGGCKASRSSSSGGTDGACREEELHDCCDRFVNVSFFFCASFFAVPGSGCGSLLFLLVLLGSVDVETWFLCGSYQVSSMQMLKRMEMK